MQLTMLLITNNFFYINTSIRILRERIIKSLNQNILHFIIKSQIKMTLSSPLTVVAMMNGMIGGVILVLPISSHQAGYIFTIVAILVTGAFSFYSCYLSLVHIGDQKDMNYSMLVHFNNHQAAKVIYDVVVWLGLFFGSMFYYGLVCIQWESILGKQSVLIPILNAAGIFFLIFVLKYFEMGSSLMAYGIVSIFAYLIFLIWVMATRPTGNVSWQPIGNNLYSFASTMSLAFAIQSFFVPVIMKNPHKSKHVFLTILTYVIGACIYTYISLMGTFGVMNRVSIINPPETIQNYFPTGNVQVTIIQCIYLIHLYSCLPQFVLISKKRLFDTFKISQTAKGKIPIKQIIYSFIFVGLCLLFRLLGVNINTIISINGSIVGFFNIYFFPAILHVKCIYFSKNKIPMPQIKENQENSELVGQYTQKRVELELKQTKSLEIQNYKDNNQDTIRSSLTYSNDQGMKTLEGNNTQNDRNITYGITEPMNQQARNQQNLNKNTFYCDCRLPSSIWLQIGDGLLILIMVGIGVAVLVNGLMGIF